MHYRTSLEDKKYINKDKASLMINKLQGLPLKSIKITNRLVEIEFQVSQKQPQHCQHSPALCF